MLVIAVSVLGPSARTGDGMTQDVLRFGVLGSSCDPARVPALREAGVTLVELVVGWDRFEPVRGEYDRRYASWLRGAVDRCRDAGLTVILSPGFHYAPAWVSALPGGAYRSHRGSPGPPQVPNFIFSAAVRRAAADYVAALSNTVDFGSVGAIRVGTTAYGEMGYPGKELGQPGEPTLWAFDPAAQTGVGLAAGMSPSPLPGWTPGSTTWHGRPIDVWLVRQWFHWYSLSAAQAVVWQIQLFRAHGYRGEIHVPLAGRGMLPAQLRAATAAYLDPANDEAGNLEKGLFYPDQLAYISSHTATQGSLSGPVVADVTGIADATATYAREVRPRQDTCLPGDQNRDLLRDDSVGTWSTFRWTVANARRSGLPVIGENPGRLPPPHSDGGPATLEQQMTEAPRYARDCGLEALLWGFEEDLFDDRHDVDLDDYARQIRAATGPG